MGEKGLLVGRQTLDRMARATRTIENRPVDLRRAQSGHRRTTAGGDYNGYLKVIQTAANKLKIIDGLDEEAADCWSGFINEFDKTATVTELTIAADAWIYLKAVPVGDPWTDATVTIEQSASALTYETEVFKHLISRVTFADGKITGYTRESSFCQGFILKECT